MHAHPNDVLIIEDHPLCVDGTRDIISRHYPLLNVTVRDSAQTALEALSDPTKEWHRILLDLGVPGACGLSLVQSIYQQGLGPITCIVTGYDRDDKDEIVAQVRSMGFLGYIPKASLKDQLATALMQVFAGERFFPPSKPGVQARRLTKRQLEILPYVRDGFLSKEIAPKLGLKIGTVDNHIDNAMGELGAHSRSHLVVIAIRLGLLDVGPDFTR